MAVSALYYNHAPLITKVQNSATNFFATNPVAMEMWAKSIAKPEESCSA